MQPVITAISSGLDLRCSIVSRELRRGERKKSYLTRGAKRTGRERTERHERERQRERDWTLEKKTFLEPWINTAVVKSEEHADGRRRRERERGRGKKR